MINTAISKIQLAKQLGISRSSLYYRPKRPAIDEEVRRQIESVLSDHPAYGHKRIAWALKLNRKRIRRVMKKFGLKPYRRKVKRPDKKADIGKPPAGYPNLIENLTVDRPGQVWVTDFTYIRFHNRFVYLSTVIDLFTREVVGFNLSRFHNRFLVMGAALDALEKYPPPAIIHSDQGSEYDSQDFIDLINSLNINISMSRKASPRENGHQESFFGRLKLEAGDLNRFDTDGELIEELCRMIYYYNRLRIHSKLKMPPAEYRLKYQNNLKEGIKSIS
jgi:transposase InsO family protein